jgi:hypothetical protein
MEENMSKVTKKLAVRLLSSLLAFSVSASCAFTAFAGSKQAAQTQTYGISATDITGDVTQKLADEALEGRYDVEEIREVALKKYNSLKDVVMN